VPVRGRHKQVAEPSYPGLFRAELAGYRAGRVTQGDRHDEEPKAEAEPDTRRFRHAQARRDGLRLALSGTPWRGKPQNFWGTLNWLRPEI